MGFGLTFRQRQLLDFICKQSEYGIAPSYKEMALELKLKSKSSIHRIIQALRKRGYIEIQEGSHRSVKVNKFDALEISLIKSTLRATIEELREYSDTQTAQAIIQRQITEIDLRYGI